MLQLLRDAKTHMSNSAHTRTQTATIVFGVSPWKQPVQQRSHTAAHWFTASPCFQLAVGVGSAFQDKVNYQQAARRHLSSLWLWPHQHGYSANQKLPVGLRLSSIHKCLSFVTANNNMPICTSYDEPAKRLSAAPALKPSVRESPHTGLCCARFPDAVGLHGCSVILLLVHLCPFLKSILPSVFGLLRCARSDLRANFRSSRR